MDNLGIDLLFNPKKRKKENKNKDNGQNKNDEIIKDLINNLDNKDIINKILNFDINIDPCSEEEITKDMIISLIKFIKLIHFKKSKKEKNKKTKKKIVETINTNNSDVKTINLDKNNSKQGIEKFFSISKIT